MDISKFIGQKRPDVEKIPGFELRYDAKLNRWAYRPEDKYSEKHIDEDFFIPKKEAFKTGRPFSEDTQKNGNSGLHAAKAEKNDEFYTRFQDIADELTHYKDFFNGKVVYCPCDKAFNLGRSEFFNFFCKVFSEWGIRKLIATQYCPNGDNRGYLWVLENNDNTMFPIDETKIDTYLLDGDGSFDSPECIKIMEESDIIVTNPPFSLFRKIVNQLISLNKSFLLMGNQNAITYKDIFGFIKEDKLWLGYTSNKTMAFRTPYTNNNDNNCRTLERMGLDPSGHILVKGISWFTNLPHKKRNEYIDLCKTYNETDYPKYDNYNAVEVSRVSDIPSDYFGAMGVPITFLAKYNPSQFQIIKFRKGDDEKDLAIGGKTPYFRILIKRKTQA